MAFMEYLAAKNPNFAKYLALQLQADGEPVDPVDPGLQEILSRPSMVQGRQPNPPRPVEMPAEAPQVRPLPKYELSQEPYDDGQPVGPDPGQIMSLMGRLEQQRSARPLPELPPHQSAPYDGFVSQVKDFPPLRQEQKAGGNWLDNMLLKAGNKFVMGAKDVGEFVANDPANTIAGPGLALGTAALGYVAGNAAADWNNRRKNTLKAWKEMGVEWPGIKNLGTRLFPPQFVPGRDNVTWGPDTGLVVPPQPRRGISESIIGIDGELPSQGTPPPVRGTPPPFKPGQRPVPISESIIGIDGDIPDPRPPPPPIDPTPPIPIDPPPPPPIPDDPPVKAPRQPHPYARVEGYDGYLRNQLSTFRAGKKDDLAFFYTMGKETGLDYRTIRRFVNDEPINSNTRQKIVEYLAKTVPDILPPDRWLTETAGFREGTSAKSLTPAIAGGENVPELSNEGLVDILRRAGSGQPIGADEQAKLDRLIRRLDGGGAGGSIEGTVPGVSGVGGRSGVSGVVGSPTLPDSATPAANTDPANAGRPVTQPPPPFFGRSQRGVGADVVGRILSGDEDPGQSLQDIVDVARRPARQPNAFEQFFQPPQTAGGPPPVATDWSAMDAAALMRERDRMLAGEQPIDPKFVKAFLEKVPVQPGHTDADQALIDRLQSHMKAKGLTKTDIERQLGHYKFLTGERKLAPEMAKRIEALLEGRPVERSSRTGPTLMERLQAYDQANPGTSIPEAAKALGTTPDRVNTYRYRLRERRRSGPGGRGGYAINPLAGLFGGDDGGAVPEWRKTWKPALDWKQLFDEAHKEALNNEIDEGLSRQRKARMQPQPRPQPHNRRHNQHLIGLFNGTSKYLDAKGAMLAEHKRIADMKASGSLTTQQFEKALYEATLNFRENKNRGVPLFTQDATEKANRQPPFRKPIAPLSVSPGGGPGAIRGFTGAARNVTGNILRDSPELAVAAAQAAWHSLRPLAPERHDETSNTFDRLVTGPIEKFSETWGPKAGLGRLGIGQTNYPPTATSKKIESGVDSVNRALMSAGKGIDTAGKAIIGGGLDIAREGTENVLKALGPRQLTEAEKSSNRQRNADIDRASEARRGEDEEKARWQRLTPQQQEAEKAANRRASDERKAAESDRNWRARKEERADPQFKKYEQWFQEYQQKVPHKPPPTFEAWKHLDKFYKGRVPLSSRRTLKDMYLAKATA